MSTSPLVHLKDPSLLKTDAFINGQWVAGSSRFAVTDPATGAHLADVANLARPTPNAPLLRPTPPGQPGAPKPPKSAASSCANGMT